MGREGGGKRKGERDTEEAKGAGEGWTGEERGGGGGRQRKKELGEGKEGKIEERRGEDERDTWTGDMK